MILWRYIENYPFFIILIPTPDFPHFYSMLGGNLRSLLYGDVSVMLNLSGDYFTVGVQENIFLSESRSQFVAKGPAKI